MAKLICCTWRWGSKYGPEYVERLQAGVARHLKQEHRFGVFTPCAEDEHLTRIPGCFVRLRMFSPEWQTANGIDPGDRVVCMDLDSIVTGELDPLFNRPDNFCILTGANASNPGFYNGSIFMFRAGFRPDVWSEFSLDAAAKAPHFTFPDDQAWLEHKIPGAVGWKVGSPSGIFAFMKPGWNTGDQLPKDARLVVFPGWRDPSRFTHLPWVKERWVA